MADVYSESTATPVGRMSGHDRLGEEMSPQKSRKRVVKDPEARRRDILEAGRRAFQSEGFETVSIASIADAAEIGKGTFYLYFDSKDDLLGALWNEYIDEIVSAGSAILDHRGDDWWGSLETLLAELIRIAVEDAELHRIVYGSGNGRALETCKSANRRVIDQICGFVEDGSRAGAFRSDGAATAFRMVYHAIDGLLDDLISAGDPLDPDAITSTVMAFTERALRPAEK